MKLAKNHTVMENLKERGLITQKEIQLFIGCSTEESKIEYKAICEGLEKDKITMKDCLHYWEIMLEKHIDYIEEQQKALKLLRTNIKGNFLVAPKDIQLCTACTIQESITVHYAICQSLEKDKLTMKDCFNYWEIKLKNNLEETEDRQKLLYLLRNNLKGSVFFTTIDIELIFFDGQNRTFIDDHLVDHSEACKYFGKEQISLLDWCVFANFDLKYLSDFISIVNEARENH